MDARGRALPGAHGREAAGADLPDNGALTLIPTLARRARTLNLILNLTLTITLNLAASWP